VARPGIIISALKKRLRRGNPGQAIIAGFIGVILAGTLLLGLPWSRTGPVSPLDALFTSTSAVCVTGLIVRDTATLYTPLGKAVIATLIQLGGLSYMTFTTVFLFLFGKKGSLMVRRTMAASYPDLSLGKLRSFVGKMLLTTFAMELAGTLALLPSFASRYGFVAGLGHASFTAISAFCNAGLSTFSTNLAEWRGNTPVNLVVLSLIVLGGLGFIVLDDLYLRFIGHRRRKLSLHSLLVVFVTGCLILGGFIILAPAEWNGAMAGFTVKEKILAGIFMAITPRTAGFNTVSYSAVGSFSLFLTMALMFIGGSPGGTAGGIKTTTLATVALRLVATMRGKEEVSALSYRLPRDALVRSFAVLVLAIATLATGFAFMALAESHGMAHRSWAPYLFELFSAFGTVGLSMGSTHVPNTSLSADLSAFGKSIIIITMLIGRIGVLSIFASLVRPEREAIRHVEGKLEVG